MADSKGDVDMLQGLQREADDWRRIVDIMARLLGGAAAGGEQP